MIKEVKRFNHIYHQGVISPFPPNVQPEPVLTCCYVNVKGKEQKMIWSRCVWKFSFENFPPFCFPFNNVSIGVFCLQGGKFYHVFYAMVPLVREWVFCVNNYTYLCKTRQCKSVDPTQKNGQSIHRNYPHMFGSQCKSNSLHSCIESIHCHLRWPEHRHSNGTLWRMIQNAWVWHETPIFVNTHPGNLTVLIFAW